LPAPVLAAITPTLRAEIEPVARRLQSGVTKGGAAIHAMDRADKGPSIPRFKFSL